MNLIYMFMKIGQNGELAYGLQIDRHWVTLDLCGSRAQMPDPNGEANVRI